jgi:hypothetical protein
VCHRTVFDAPPDSVRCTREINSKLATFGNLGSHSAIIHRTVRCAKRSNDYLLQWSSAMATLNSEQSRLCAQSQSKRQMAHQTVNRTCPVHHRTVRWPTCQKLQRSNPNSYVTWLAHQTVSGGAPDCPVRHTTAAFPNGHFGGWGYKYPQPPRLKASKQSLLLIQYRSNTQHSKTQIKATNRIKVHNSTLVFRTCDKIDLCSFVVLVAWLAFLLSLILTLKAL